MKTAPVRTLILLLAALLLTDLPTLAPPAAAGAPTEEAWYVAAIGGTPVGYARESREIAGHETRVRSESHMVLNRMGSRIEIEMLGESRERADGSLLTVEMEMVLSEQATKMKAAAGDGVVRIESEAGGKSFERDLPFTGELSGPDAVRRLTAAKLRQAGDRIDYQIFSPEMGTVTKASRVALGPESITFEGRQQTAMKLEEQLEGFPVKTTVWVDSEGFLLRSEQPGPFGVMSLLRANEAAARLASGGGQLPEESYGATIARTQIRIPDARRLNHLEVRLHHRNPALGWPELEGPGQEILERSDDSLTLAITRPAPAEGHPFPVAVTEANREYLEPNAYIQSDAAALKEEARKIIGDEKDLYRAARKLERWVAENMEFDTGVVLAPSVEVFENRRGTCAGYAMLLTTMARAVGIPSRYVMGYVYVDGMFGGHAWTEVLAGDEWIPFDGAVITEGPADAGRFAFLWSSLRDGVNRLSMGPGMQLYGQIDLDVLTYTLEGGPRRSVPPGAAPYEIAGDLYTNTGLGLQVVKPAGFRFVDLDAVWPEATLVGLEGPAGQEVKLLSRNRRYWQDPREHALEALRRLAPEGSMSEVRLAGGDGLLTVNGDRAVLAVPGSGVTWLLDVTGPEAAALIRQVASGLKLQG